VVFPVDCDPYIIIIIGEDKYSNYGPDKYSNYGPDKYSNYGEEHSYKARAIVLRFS
jgi:hypothetical protein